MKKEKLVELDGMELFAVKGLVENELVMKNDEEEVKITVSSTEYENDYNEFMFNDLLDEPLKSNAQKLLNHVSKQVEELGEFTMYTLKDSYKEKLHNL